MSEPSNEPPTQVFQSASLSAAEEMANDANLEQTLFMLSEAASKSTTQFVASFVKAMTNLLILRGVKDAEVRRAIVARTLSAFLVSQAYLVLRQVGDSPSAARQAIDTGLNSAEGSIAEHGIATSVFADGEGLGLPRVHHNAVAARVLAPYASAVVSTIVTAEQFEQAHGAAPATAQDLARLAAVRHGEGVVAQYRTRPAGQSTTAGAPAASPTTAESPAPSPSPSSTPSR